MKISLTSNNCCKSSEIVASKAGKDKDFSWIQFGRSRLTLKEEGFENITGIGEDLRNLFHFASLSLQVEESMGVSSWLSILIHRNMLLSSTFLSRLSIRIVVFESCNKKLMCYKQSNTHSL